MTYSVIEIYEKMSEFYPVIFLDVGYYEKMVYNSLVFNGSYQTQRVSGYLLKILVNSFT